MSLPSAKLTLNVAETAHALSISERQVAVLVKRGELRPVKGSRRVTFYIAEIHRYLLTNTDLADSTLKEIAVQHLDRLAGKLGVVQEAA